MKKIVKLTETDLTRLVKRVINEEKSSMSDYDMMMETIFEEYIDQLKKVHNDYKEELEDLFDQIEMDDNLTEDEIGELLDNGLEIMSFFDKMEKQL